MDLADRARHIARERIGQYEYALPDDKRRAPRGIWDRAAKEVG